MSGQIQRQGRMQEKTHWLWNWGPVIAYCTLIFWGSAQPHLTPPEFLPSDKVAHSLEYSILGILWARAARATWSHWSFALLLGSTILFVGVYGMSDEWHQFYVPGRFSDWSDVVADTCGGTIGGILYLVRGRFLARETEPSPTPAT